MRLNGFAINKRHENPIRISKTFPNYTSLHFDRRFDRHVSIHPWFRYRIIFICFCPTHLLNWKTTMSCWLNWWKLGTKLSFTSQLRRYPPPSKSNRQIANYHYFGYFHPTQLGRIRIKNTLDWLISWKRNALLLIRRRSIRSCWNSNKNVSNRGVLRYQF